MKILLSNDDGYHAEGIQLMKKLLQKYGTVYTVAPSTVKSGASSSLTLKKKMKLIRHDMYNYELDGTPVDCVCFGLNALNVDFDLVVSGCNNGYNLSFDAVYSGTLGACFQAMVQSVKTFAFSTDVGNFAVVEKYGEEVIDYIFQKQLLKNDIILNVNFPSSEDVKGIFLTQQHFRKVSYTYTFEEDNVCSNRQIEDDGNCLNLDTVAVKNGYISITPLKRTSYSDNLLKEMKGMIPNET